MKDENVPMDVTHVIVEESVTVIKKKAFYNCQHLVSVMMDNSAVRRIEENSFSWCKSLKVMKLSKTLEFIGICAFSFCKSLEAVFLPMTLASIEASAFMVSSLRLLVLPDSINLNKVDRGIINGASIYHIAKTAGVQYEIRAGDTIGYTNESNRGVNDWLIHHMDESPLHKVCYDPSVTTEKIATFLNRNGSRYTLQKDASYSMCPLHILTMNPHAPIDAIAALLDSNLEAVLSLDNKEKTPLDYARDYNVSGLVALIKGLCIYKNASALPVEEKPL